MFDGLNLEIPPDTDLLFRKTGNWMCSVIPANEEPVAATNSSVLCLWFLSLSAQFSQLEAVLVKVG